MIDPETHIYRLDGVIIPSVTQVLSEFGFLSTEWVTPQALYRGRYVHQALHYLNEGDYDINDCLPECCNALVKAVGKMINTIADIFDDIR